jgi:hypothetical protein
MPNLLAMSFEGELAPCFDLRCLDRGQRAPDGWGIGYYPGGEPSASVLKEPAPPNGSIRSELVKALEHLEASLFVLHIRTATWDVCAHGCPRLARLRRRSCRRTSLRRPRHPTLRKGGSETLEVDLKVSQVS